MTQMIANGSVPKSFGFCTATCLVIGNMIGSGIFLIPQALAAIGPISILGWVVTATGAVSLALVFAKLSRRNPESGGPFVHARHAYGEFVGFLMAWGYWTMVWSSNGGIALALVSYLSHYFPIIQMYEYGTFVAAASLIWFSTFINCLGLRYGSFVQILTVIIKLTPLVLVGIFGIFYFDASLYQPLIFDDQPAFSAILGAAAITMWAFLGLESATVPADNVVNADKTVPRATLFGTSLVAVIYISVTVILFGLVSCQELAGSQAPFILAASKIFGDQIAPYIGICILISGYGALNGWTLLQGQVPLTIAKEGLFPKVFGYVKTDGTPIFGLIFSSILITLMLALNLGNSLAEQFNNIILVGAITTLVAYGVTVLAALKIFEAFSKPSQQLPLISAAIIGLTYVLGAVMGAGLKIVIICLIGYSCGLPIYWYYSRRLSCSPMIGGK